MTILIRSKLLLLLSAAIVVLCAAQAPAAWSREEHVQFQSAGKTINAELYIPERQSKYPVVILLHGRGGVPADHGKGLADVLLQQGIGSMCLHYFDAYPPPSPPYLRPWLQAGHDAITYLLQQPDVEKEHIGIYGGSLGAILGCALAASDQRVAVLVEVAGNLPGFIQVKRLPPTLILHGDSDQVVSVNGAYQLAAKIKELGGVGEMQIYPGVGHDFARVGEDSTKRAVWFLVRYLKVGARQVPGH